jgi:hypothetical protein
VKPNETTILKSVNIRTLIKTPVNRIINLNWISMGIKAANHAPIEKQFSRE